MQKAIILALFLACGPAQAVADETSDVVLSNKFGTERGAQIAITKFINEFEAALPALTPEQQEYIKREEAFKAGPGSVGIGGTFGERVNAYMNGKEFRLWRAHSDLEQLRGNLEGVKLLTDRPERFAFWSAIIVQMSFPSGMEVALQELHRMGVLDKNALGRGQGVNWLGGPSEGVAQILWPFWAGTMWASWCYQGIFDATGATQAIRFMKP